MPQQYERLADSRHILPGALDLFAAVRSRAVSLAVIIANEKPSNKGFLSQWLTSRMLDGTHTSSHLAIIFSVREVQDDPHGCCNEVPNHQLGMYKMIWVPR